MIVVSRYKWESFKVFEGMVYHVKERHLEIAQHFGITVSSNSGKTYPAYCCRFDPVKSLFWMIPLSRNVQKYKALRDREVERYNNERSFVFGQYDGGEAVFLVKSLFPVTREFILHPHTRKGETVPVEQSIQEEIREKFELTYRFSHSGTRCALSDIVKLEQLLLE